MHIVAYEPKYASAFRDLNLQWIEEFFSVEERDRAQLEDPDATILAAGGSIFVALRDEEPVGVCALAQARDGTLEVVKMAVAREYRRQGVARALLEAALNAARDRGASEVFLLTHPLLPAAVSLYRSVGFADVPLVPSEHARAASGIRMRKALDETHKASKSA